MFQFFSRYSCKSRASSVLLFRCFARRHANSVTLSTNSSTCCCRNSSTSWSSTSPGATSCRSSASLVDTQVKETTERYESETGRKLIPHDCVIVHVPLARLDVLGTRQQLAAFRADKTARRRWRHNFACTQASKNSCSAQGLACKH
jgi:hypothetical protein